MKPASPLIVGMDVDDVCANLTEAWLLRYNQETGDNLTADDIKCWDIAKYATRMSRADFFKILHEPGLYDGITPMEGAKAAIYGVLAQGVRVVYITASVGDTAGAKKDWLVRYGFLSNKNKHRDFIAAHDKSLVSGAHMLFDDRVDNVESFPNIGVLVNRPHNRELDCTKLRVDLKDIPEVVRAYKASPYRDFVML